MSHEPELQQRFAQCDRCRVRRPLAQLRALRTQCVCIRIEHCTALLMTTPKTQPTKQERQGAA